MKQKLSSSVHQLSDETYLSSRKRFYFLLFLGIFGFIFAILYNFPIKKKLQGLILSTIGQNNECPTSVSSLEINSILTGLEFKNTTISGICFNQPGAQLNLEKIRAGFSGIGISPFGPKFYLEILNGRTNIDLDLVFSMGQFELRINPSTLDSELLSELMGKKILLKGQFKIEGMGNIKNNVLTGGNLLLTSSNFTFPAQNIQSFMIPSLPINDFDLNATFSDNGNITINNLSLGHSNAPINSKLKGSLGLNLNHIESSMLILNGKIKFSADFQRDFPILNLLIGGKKTDSEGQMDLSIEGPIAAPRPRIL